MMLFWIRFCIIHGIIAFQIVMLSGINVYKVLKLSYHSGICYDATLQCDVAYDRT